MRSWQVEGEEKEAAFPVGQLVKHSPLTFVRPARQPKQSDRDEQLAHPKMHSPAFELFV